MAVSVDSGGNGQTVMDLNSFLYSGGVFTTIDDPVPNSHTLAHGINNNSQIVGTLSSGANHGFLETPFPNPPPPAGTTALMIMSNPSNGSYEVYNVGGNAILAAYDFGQVGTAWAFAALGTFQAGDSSDMLLRNSS